MKRGSKQAEDAAEKRRALDDYFFQRGGEGHCQICGGFLKRDEADACHKVRASQGGSCDPSNLVAAHGFRSYRKCHQWADAKPARYKQLEESPANLLNGEKVEWKIAQKLSLRYYIGTGMDRFLDP